MDKISERVMALSPSATFAMSQKAADLKATGLDVISLSVGEPDFNTPDHIKEAAKKAIDDNFSFYTPVPGYLSLREAICRKLKRENGLDFTPAQIVVGNGAKQELCDVILSVVNKGEEVLIPVPAWVSYMEMVKIAEGVPVLIYAGPEQKFKVTPQQLEAAITPKTKAVLICSPSNPTGSVYSKEELQGLVDVLARYPDIIVIADEIYEHITYVGPTTSLASFPEIKDRVVVINGVSKAYAMTGWRIGYCAAPLPIAKAVYMNISADSPNLEIIKKKMRSDKPEARIEADSIAFSSAFRYTDFGDRWVDLVKLSREVGTDYGTLLSQVRDGYAELPDGNGNLNIVYFFSLMRAGQTGPVEYFEEQIRDIILSTRKQALLSRLERDLIENARNQENFVIY